MYNEKDLSTEGNPRTGGVPAEPSSSSGIPYGSSCTASSGAAAVINPGFVETEATAINDFTMPDLITSDVAAMYIIDGLRRDEFEISFPKSFVRKMKFMRLLPVSTYLRLTAKLTGHR